MGGWDAPLRLRRLALWRHGRISEARPVASVSVRIECQSEMDLTAAPKGREARAARVAIVVTCFDDGATLGETIASIRDGAARAELVIVNDGSTDARTLAVLAELERLGVRVVHQPNQGQARAAMAGVEATSAPYVMRFDADDLLQPDAVEALADELDAAPQAAAAWGDVETTGLTSFRIPGIPALDPWLVTYTNCITGSGTLVRRSALTSVGGWQLREGFEDWDLWMSLADAGFTGVCVPRVVFRYRRDHGGQLTGWLDETDRHYRELRRRHERLFAKRPQSRRESTAPLILKGLVPLTEIVPRMSRLTRINLCELYTRLFWGGGLRATAPMVRQAAALRLRRRYFRRYGRA
jgi:glycosyltransferase involved in cell wall biosynthesis